MQKIMATFFMVLAMLGMTVTSAAAQGRARGRVFTKADVNRIIIRVEERADVFRKAIDRNLDKSRLDDTKREDRINEQVKQLENALDELRREFDRRDTWRETRREVEKALRQSDEVNAILRTHRFFASVEAQWRGLRADLNRLAGVYDLPLLRD